MPYIDTSVIGSYYCLESTSPAVNRAFQTIQQVTISPLVELEFLSLLALKVRTGILTQPAALSALGQFQVHQSSGLYGFVEIGPREFDVARNWLLGFSTALRTLDALHLATAFSNQQTLWTTDKALARAAGQLRIDHQLITP